MNDDDNPRHGGSPPFPVAGPAKPRRAGRRAALVAAVAAGLLVTGGLGGYALGSTAAGPGASAAGSADADGGFGHHRGPFGPDGGSARDGGRGLAPDGPVPDGTVPDGSDTPGTGTGGGAGTGTGTTGTSA